jgi:tRNA-specific 2-thiouridylase
MSGGVDSSLAAALLKERGHEVMGVYLDCWDEPGCGVNQDRRDALKVAMKLGIKLKILDFKKEYKKKVIGWFYREIKAGRTSNPDVVCNREIKFGLFYDWVMKQGFDYVATGHYARIKNNRLYQAADKQKDQTYFLYNLRQEQLGKILFPIGEMTKAEVRKEVKKKGLHNWDKKDSVGICFIGNRISFEEFLAKKIKTHKGEVVDKQGKVIGSHKGVEFYTIGQRHGFDTNSKFKKQNAAKMYVVSKDMKTNRLVVGEKKKLERKEFEIKGLHQIDNRYQMPDSGLKCRIRHQGRLIGCRLKQLGKGRYKVGLDELEMGVAEGQICVFYQGKECLGGGVIS